MLLKPLTLRGFGIKVKYYYLLKIQKVI